MVLDPINDLLVDDFFVNNDADVSPEQSHNMSGVVGSTWTALGVQQGWERVAFINSTIGLYDAPSSAGYWAYYSVRPVGTGGGLILANVKLISDGQSNRFMDQEGLIIVDSVFNPDGASYNGWRVHQESNNVFARDLTVVGSIQMNQPGANATNCTILRLNAYSTDGAEILHSGSNTGELTDSTFHHSTGGTFPGSGDLDDGGGNTWVSWDGSTLPDFSSYGAQR
jgi:hypothetical protein